LGGHHQCRGHHHGDSCGCGGPSHFQRRFQTQEEKLARLERYLENLREEAKGVEEHIAKLKKEE
jgi:hypothetical protein